MDFEQLSFFRTQLPFAELTRGKAAYVAVRVNSNIYGRQNLADKVFLGN
jgi:hypothetical protein